MSFAFGATGLRGEACPVPAADGIVPFTFKPETHDAWCDCMYNSDPALLLLCKIKFGESLPNGDPYLDPSMPWTVTGKRTRGLTDDALGRALRQLLHAGTQAVINAGEQIGVVPMDTSTHPAGPAGPVGMGTGSTNQQTAEEIFRTRGQTTLIKSSRTVRQGLQEQHPDADTGWTMPTLPSVGGNTLLYGAAAAAAVWWFFLRPKRVTLSGFGGYRKRRRALRSRR